MPGPLSLKHVAAWLKNDFSEVMRTEARRRLRSTLQDFLIILKAEGLRVANTEEERQAINGVSITFSGDTWAVLIAERDHERIIRRMEFGDTDHRPRPFIQKALKKFKI